MTESMIFEYHLKSQPKDVLLCPMCGKGSREEDPFAVRNTACGKEYGHYRCFIKRLDPFKGGR